MITVRRFRARLNRELGVGLLPGPSWATAAAFAAGRFMAPRATPWIAGAVGAAGLAWIVAALRRHGWTEAQAAVRLDRLAACDGLLLALRDVPDARWSDVLAGHLAAARLPPLRVLRPLALVAGASVFTVLALLVPLPAPARTPAETVADHTIEALAKQADALSREQALSPALAAEIERLRQEAKAARFDAADWQASDAAREAMQDAARNQAEALQRAQEAASRMEAALAQGTSAEQQAQRRDALEKALMAVSPGQGTRNATAPRQGKQGGPSAQAGQEGGRQGRGGASGDTSGTRSAAELKALQKALRDRQEQLEKQFPGSGKPGKGMRGEHFDNGDPESAGRVEAMLVNADEDGAPVHGPAPRTPVRFGDETKFEKNRLRYAPMPKTPGRDPAGELWGLSPASPVARPDAPIAAPAGKADGDETLPGTEAAHAPPRDRALVQKYFSSPDAVSPPADSTP